MSFCVSKRAVEMSQGSAAIGSWENAGEKSCDQMYQALNKASSKILELKNSTFKKSRHCFSLIAYQSHPPASTIVIV